MRDDYSHLSGHRFPGGTVTVPHWMNALWADAVLAEDPGPYVHPVLVYYAAIEGSGVTIEGLFELMEADAGSGAMFGEQRLEFRKPVVVGRPYQVEGEVVDVVRKHGKRTGPFDLLTFSLRLTEQGEQEPTAISTSTFVFPRREAA